jgi:3',5'-cyclic-AMP phosphodiesterase
MTTDFNNTIGRQVLSWMHVGDLHLTEPHEANYRDLQALIATANANLAGAADFVLLPGDNADDGTEPQFRLVRDAIASLKLPLYILPGDHDFKQSLDTFHRVLGADVLPKALAISGVHCLFLDVVSAGTGGPDFRLADCQLAWLSRELALADAAGQDSVIFMHTYPADLKAGRTELRGLIARHRVIAVDMGHTHYNELANDGHAIYSATRSTGQIEEGPVGFSMMAVDRGVVSWRFKPLANAWPFVLITSPADRRLVIDPDAPDQVVRGSFEARAKVWSGRGIASVSCQVDAGPWQPMSPAPGCPNLWQCCCAAPSDRFVLTVSTTDGDGIRDHETLQVATGRFEAPRRMGDGSDADAIGAWPEKGILGKQLGPNRNGKKW